MYKRQGVLDREERRLGDRGLLELRGCGLLVAVLGEDEAAQVLVEVRGEQLGAPVEFAGEERLVGVQVAGHAGVLGALAGEEEGDGGVAAGGAGGVGLGEAAQGGGGLGRVGGHDGGAGGVGPAAAGEGVGDVAEGEVRVGLEVVGQAPGAGRQGGRGLRRQRQHLHGPGGPAGRRLRRLLEDDVHVGAADAEGADAGAARGVVPGGPGAEGVVDEEGAGVQGEFGVGPAEAEAGGDGPVAQREGGLDQGGDAGGGVEVAHVGLDRADRAVAGVRGVLAVGAGEGGDLDGVAEGGAGAVGLDVADGRGVHLGHGQRLGDDLGLALDTGRGVTGLEGAVVVDGRAADDGVHGVAAVERVGQAAQDDDAGAVAGDGAVGVGVEGPAVAVGGEDAALFVDVAGTERYGDGDAAGEGDVALSVQQALAGEVHGREGGGAGGLDGDGGALEVELVGGPGREEVLVAREEGAVDARGVEDPPVPGDVEEQVGVEAGAGEDADAALEAGRVDAGGLQCLPGHLEEDPVLGVEEFGLAGAVAEEAGVEAVGVRQDALGPDVARVAQLGRVDARLQELLVGEGGYGLPALLEVPPEGVDVRCAREAPGHADDRHLVRVVSCVWHVGHLPFRERARRSAVRCRRLWDRRRLSARSRATGAGPPREAAGRERYSVREPTVGY